MCRSAMANVQVAFPVLGSGLPETERYLICLQLFSRKSEGYSYMLLCTSSVHCTFPHILVPRPHGRPGNEANSFSAFHTVTSFSFITSKSFLSLSGKGFVLPSQLIPSLSTTLDQLYVLGNQ